MVVRNGKNIPRLKVPALSCQASFLIVNLFGTGKSLSKSLEKQKNKLMHMSLRHICLKVYKNRALLRLEEQESCDNILQAGCLEGSEFTHCRYGRAKNRSPNAQVKSWRIISVSRNGPKL